MVDTAQLIENFTKRIPANVKKAIVKSMEKSATELTASMKRLVPVETGKLRDSIRWTWAGDEQGGTIVGQVKGGPQYATMRILVMAGNEETLTVSKAGKRYQVARLVEFGTLSMHAQPYFYPSYRLHKQKIRSRMRAAINYEIKKNLKPPERIAA